MSDLVGLICLTAIFGAGIAVGYFVAMVRLRGRPRLIFSQPSKEAKRDTH